MPKNPSKETQRSTATLELWPGLDAGVHAALGYRTAADVLLDPRGFTVRCVPWRRTVAFTLADGTRLYRKHVSGGRDDARLEWRWLQQAQELGLRTAAPVCFAADGADSALVLRELPGRPLAARLGETLHRGDAAEIATLAHTLNHSLAPLLRRLHQRGVVYRDLYWNHLFADDPFTEPLDPAPPPAFLDLGRMLRPRWRLRRWIVKDLAGLLATLPRAPHTFTRPQHLRFLRTYFTTLPADWKPWSRAILTKARRIQSHQPKYG